MRKVRIDFLNNGVSYKERDISDLQQKKGGRITTTLFIVQENYWMSRVAFP